MKLKFKHQPFQAEAAAAVCDVFNDQPLRTANYRIDLGDTTNMQQRMDFSEVGFRNHPLVPELTRSRILENLRAVQIRNNLKPSDALAGPGINLTIEMETGTGKTYTYVKTMYELNRRYGWSKFIIVVPSVAIREGVAKSLETTQQHFSDEYGKKIRFFTYSSDKLTEVDNFASDSGIYAMIINMQAFNSSKNQKIIDKKLDSFRSRRPIDIIAQTNPILIIDEPQSVEGKQTKESLKKFNALFTLRYSATHKEKYDMVYRLDAMDAYNQHLVKKIAALGITLTGTTATNSFVYVEGVDIYKNKAPTARLGFEIKGKTGTRTMVRKVQGGDDLYTLSGELDEYADRFVILPDGIDGRDNSVTFLNGLKLYAGQISGNEQMTALQRRIQIRETSVPISSGSGNCIPGASRCCHCFSSTKYPSTAYMTATTTMAATASMPKCSRRSTKTLWARCSASLAMTPICIIWTALTCTRPTRGIFLSTKRRAKKPALWKERSTAKRSCPMMWMPTT